MDVALDMYSGDQSVLRHWRTGAVLDIYSGDQSIHELSCYITGQWMLRSIATLVIIYYTLRGSPELSSFTSMIIPINKRLRISLFHPVFILGLSDTE